MPRKLDWTSPNSGYVGSCGRIASGYLAQRRHAHSSPGILSYAIPVDVSLAALQRLAIDQQTPTASNVAKMLHAVAKFGCTTCLL